MPRACRTLLLKPKRLERGKKYPLDADPRHSRQQRASAEHTFWMVDALIDASKPYELQLYPGQTHGISGEQDRLHLFRTMEEFWIRELRDIPSSDQR